MGKRQRKERKLLEDEDEGPQWKRTNTAFGARKVAGVVKPDRSNPSTWAQPGGQQQARVTCRKTIGESRSSAVTVSCQFPGIFPVQTIGRTPAARTRWSAAALRSDTVPLLVSSVP